MKRLIPALLLSSMAVFALPSCAPTRPAESFRSLIDQGILPLSSTNPYVGANLFIAAEAQRSTVLRNFLEGRGAPLGIEVFNGGSQGLGRLMMYYPRERQAYTADAEERKITPTVSTREWIVRGPYQIQRLDFKRLAGVMEQERGEPVFMFLGKQHRFNSREEQLEDLAPILVPVFPTPMPTAKPKPRKPASVTPAEPAIEKPGEFKPLNSDQQALMMSRGFAERAENGDVIHTARDGETILQIARWYTGSEAGSAVVATANGLAASATLFAGQRVRIPLAVVKTTRQMAWSGAGVASEARPTATLLAPTTSPTAQTSSAAPARADAAPKESVSESNTEERKGASATEASENHSGH